MTSSTKPTWYLYLYKRYSSLRRKIRAYRYWHPPVWESEVLAAYVAAKQKKNQGISFVQVGSNNGINGDPLYPFIIQGVMKGVLVEPVPYLCAELQENYKAFAQHLHFENSALASKSGSLTFYRLQKSDAKNLPVFYDQIGSFNKEVVLKHRNAIPGFDALFMEDKVNAITFKQLAEKYAITDLDLIHIDTEGYDFEILKMIDFKTLRPEFIMFEHIHLSDSDYKSALKLLKNNGYNLGMVHRDTFAISSKLSL